MGCTNKATVLALIAGLVVPALALAADNDHATIQVTAVLATNRAKAKPKAKEVDPRLHVLKSQLRRFPFRNYKLLRMESYDLRRSDQCGVELPGSRYLQVTAVERTPQYLKLRIILNQNNRPVMAAQVSLQGNSRVLLAGPRTDDGTLLVAIGAKEPR